MAVLKVTYATQEEIPEAYVELYRERDGKFELRADAIEGVKTQADVDRVQEAIRKEKAEHKATREKLQLLGDIDPATVPAALEELNEVKAQLATVTKDGKVNQEAVQAQIDAAVNRAVGPINREKAQLARDLENTKKTVAEKDQEVGTLKGSITQSKIEGVLRDAAIAAKVLPTAIDDAVKLSTNLFEITEDGRILTRDNVGVTPGIEAKDYLKDAQERRPHWWPPSVGGGAQGGRGGGGAGDNPWSAGKWNLTAQGAYVKQHGEAKAAEAARAAGVTLGALRPAKSA